MPDEMLTTEQAAKCLGVSRQRVLQFVETGRLAAQKVGRDWVVRSVDLNAFANIPRSTGRPRKG